MSSAVAGYKATLGADAPPACYDDLQHARCLFIAGSNAAYAHPVLFRRIEDAKRARPALKIIVVDPRRTDTAEIADLHLRIEPGTDVMLLHGMLHLMLREGWTDTRFIAAHTHGFEDLQTLVRDYPPQLVAQVCGISVDALTLAARWFAGIEPGESRQPTLSLYCQGLNQSSSGTAKNTALINLHLATGQIGRPGAGPFSLTGQPNAMGGREVGGLANMLAAHMDLENAAHRERVQRFWDSPVLAAAPGLKAVDLFEAVHAGRVKAIWIMATNPVVSLPDADRVRAALARCELVVVSDCIADTDTVRLAHVKLPALGWGEKDGTVTNSERRISRQRAFLPAPGEARPDWWIVAEVAKRMGFGAGFGYDGPAAIFREHAALSAFENEPGPGRRDFDIGAVAALDAAAYDALAPFQWPWRRGEAGGSARLFGDGRFFTDDGRARLLPVRARGPVNTPDADWPVVLNTGRIRDQWHTMTRTGLAPRLLQHIGEPFCALHPEDADRLGIGERDLVVVESRWGRALLRAQRSTDQVPGSVFVPMHWTGVLSSAGRIGAVVNPVVDPVSGQPESKHTPVRVRRFGAAWQGFLLATGARPLPAADYAVAVRGGNFWRFELAGAATRGGLAELANELLGTPSKDEQGIIVPGVAVETLEYVDDARGVYRRAAIAEGRLQSVCFLGPDGSLPDRQWLSGLIGKELSSADRRALLSGRPADPGADTGRVICACHGVGETTIRRLIATQQLDSVAAIGKACRAGTNCGSCQPELKNILASCREPADAARASA
jgi:assimilatory nitrate reductase catalytic subunit